MNFGSIHTLRSLSDEGGDLCKVWFRLVQKCEFVQRTKKHTHPHIHTNFSFIYKKMMPGINYGYLNHNDKKLK
jgi:hypothetical protein